MKVMQVVDMVLRYGIIVIAWSGGMPYKHGRFGHDATADTIWRWATERSDRIPDKLEIFIDYSPRDIEANDSDA